MEACPFSFEERERERRALKEKRLAELRNEEVGDASGVYGLAEEVTSESHWWFCFPSPEQVPQFKAQPLPDFDAVVLPEKKKLEPTKPEPFRLLVDQRGAVKSSRLEQMVHCLVLLRSPNCRSVFPEFNTHISCAPTG